MSRLNKSLLAGLCATGLALFGAVRAGIAGDFDASEPCVKCLDDLFHPFQADTSRDPWEERIETDRHDFTQSPKTVGRGVAQLEAGYTYFYKDQNEEIEQSHTAPELLLRVGLTQDVEFRVRWNYVWQEVAVPNVDEKEYFDGAEDLRWGFKLALTDQAGLIPESALKLESTAPTGGSDWSTEHVEFGLVYIYGWKLADRWNLTGSSGVLTQGLDEFGLLPDEPASDRFLVGLQSVSLGYELTEQNTMYVEWFGEFSHGLADEFVLSVFNVGVDHYFTDNFVVDFRVGMGLTDDSDDLFAGVGGAFRF
jgi:hypothetical protein